MPRGRNNRGRGRGREGGEDRGGWIPPLPGHLGAGAGAGAGRRRLPFRPLAALAAAAAAAAAVVALRMVLVTIRLLPPSSVAGPPRPDWSLRCGTGSGAGAGDWDAPVLPDGALLVPVRWHREPYVMAVHSEGDVVSEKIAREGAWEIRITRMILGALDGAGGGGGGGSPSLMIDVGANIGWFTAYMAAAGHDVIAIEPFGLNTPLLMHTLCRPEPPELAGRVRAYRVALSDPAGAGRTMCLRSTSPEANRGNAQMVAAADGNGDGNGDGGGEREGCQERIRTATLDGLLFEEPHGPGLVRRPAVIKMDIEGYETRAVLGAGNLFSSLPPCYVFFEHQPEASRATGVPDYEIFRLLEGYGYEIYDAGAFLRVRPPGEGEGGGLYPTRVGMGMDYFALLPESDFCGGMRPLVVASSQS